MQISIKEWQELKRIEGVIVAINSLHDAGYAHFISLPNICFKEDGTAVLIDLDWYERLHVTSWLS